MKRPLALCLAVLLAAGCRGAGQTTDPFFGRNTVPPPRTGQPSGNRTAPYSAASPAPTTAPVVAPRPAPVPAPLGVPAPVVAPAPTAAAPAQPLYQTPAAQPLYGSGSRPVVSAPATAQPRLLPGSVAGPVGTPQVSVPRESLPAAQPSVSPQPSAIAPVAPPVASPAVPPAVAPLAPVTPQPTYAPAPAGPTLRPAAAIPAPAYQGQWCPPASNLNCRPCITRPLQPRMAYNTCPPGTVPVPCVPLYDPRRASAPANCPINITDLPEAR